MIFSSAGHVALRGSKHEDSGAVGIGGIWEADLTVRVRNAVNDILRGRGYKVVEDRSEESLREYLERIKPGPASVVIEYHFDCSDLPTPHGCSALVADNASANSIGLAKDACIAINKASGIAIRDAGTGKGFLYEHDSHRGRLGLMREAGTVALVELGFLSNANDMHLFNTNFDAICLGLADVVEKWEKAI